MEAGLLVGAVGDVGLQMANRRGLVPDSGLPAYFASQPSPATAALKAALLTGFWSWAYFELDPAPSLPRFAVFAGAVDLLYRKGYSVLYPSLKPYYEANSTLTTIAYNVVVAGLVWYVRKFLIQL